MAKYLYGAAVQGIQGFIFQTNKLKEIAGASELVECICGNLFEDTFKEAGKGTKKEKHTILTAAGNIKYLFDEEDEKEQMEYVVKHFPKKVMEFAPGVTISQALVKVPEELDKEHIDELERKLRAQRNRAGRPSDVGFLATKRSRRTGLPAVTMHERKGEEKDFRDEGTHRKITIIEKEKKREERGRLANTFFGENYPHELSLDFEKMAKSRGNNYSWLAIIHADGNNMGLMLQNLADEMKEKDNYNKDAFRDFSQKIQKSTEDSASEAFRKLNDDIEKEILNYNKNYETKNGFPYNVPFRPIVIGGDDVTIVCRADLALQYTSNFLRLFEEKTKENLESLGYGSLKNGITACAGIAYVKYSFPFHFGYELAEELCAEAKKIAKKINPERSPACVMFHKIQDSFVVDYKAIKEKELTTTEEVRFDFGPYFLHKEESAGYSTIEEVKNKVNIFNDKEGSALKSHLRQWLTDLHNNPQLAEQKIKRMLTTISQSKLKNAGLTNPENLFHTRNVGDEKLKFTPVFDWLTIHSINEGGK